MCVELLPGVSLFGVRTQLCTGSERCLCGAVFFRRESKRPHNAGSAEKLPFIVLLVLCCAPANQSCGAETFPSTPALIGQQGPQWREHCVQAAMQKQSFGPVEGGSGFGL